MALGEFLARPKLVYRAVWAPESNLGFSINPWGIFMSSPEIVRKLENFAYFRGDMRIKVTVAGTPFHYGRAIVAYKPLHTNDQVDKELSANQHLILMSQRQHFYINPTESAGGEMLLPFVFPKNYADLTTNDISLLGELVVKSLCPLHHGNEDDAGAITPVDISVYAWMENIQLSMPTSVLNNSRLSNEVIDVVRESDEYQDPGPVAKTAAKVAAASGMVAIHHPEIAPFALATSAFAGTLSAVADIFGFSRPPILEKKCYYTPELAGNLAQTDQPETCHKLSLDSKQELTIDPRTVGLGGTDELAMAHLLSKESYFAAFPWVPSDTAGSPLATITVNPNIVDITNDSNGEALHTATTMSYISSLFRYWRGSIKYRFMIVASKFHRGRLRVTWDPKGTPGETTVAMSKIIDISQETDFEFEVGYGQEVSYLSTHSFPFPQLFSSGQGPLPASSYDNGTLRIEVVDSLAAPGDSDPIYLIAFASAGDDFELALPTDRTISRSTFFPLIEEPPSDDDLDTSLRSKVIDVRLETSEVGIDDSAAEDADAPEHAATTTTFIPDQGLPNLNKVHFGEKILSLRTLMKRYNYMETDRLTVIGNTPMLFDRVLETMPRSPGFAQVPENDIENLNHMTFINWITPMFLGWRGALRYKYLLTGAQHGNINVNRDPEGFSSRDFPLETDGAGAMDMASLTPLYNTGIAGNFVSPTSQMPCAEVELPYYSPRRFSSGRTIESVQPARPFLVPHEIERHLVQTTVHSESFSANRFANLERFVSVGEDFNCFWFQTTVPYYERQ